MNYTFKIEKNNSIPDNIGGKAKNLCILKNNNINVPPAFVVNSSAFSKHISKLKIDGIELPNILANITNIDSVTQALLKKIKEEIIDTPLIVELRNAITDEIRVFPSKVNFAVRSSAAVEDSEEFSWAGQFESLLNIPNSINEIESAIKNVWASTFSFRSISYCIKNKITTVEEMKMSVIIQKMVDTPDFSGVLFTDNPIAQKDNTIYIEYTEGYGDKLVSGIINPHKLTINKDDDSYSSDDKEIINLTLLKSLKYNSMLIEEIYNKPQDIEWSISKNEIFFLQSRPITSSSISKEYTINSDEIPLVKGLPVSSGVGIGKAIIIHNIHDATNIKEGEIIVAPMTNPDMVPYMRNSTAIVTDVGGMISHTAIVAREMQIPCIVGTNNATKIIKKSEIITVDGDSGNVYKGSININSNSLTIQEIIKSISKSFEKSFNQDNILFYFGIDRPHSFSNYKKIVINPHFIDLQSKFQKARNVDIKEQDRLKTEFISNVQYIVTNTTCQIALIKSNIIKDYETYDFVKENKERISFENEQPVLSGISNIDLKELTKFSNSKNFFGHVPHIVSEGFPYPPRIGPWWPENWNHNWENKSPNQKISWGNIRPEIVNTPFTKSLIVQGVEKIPYIFDFDNLGPLYTKWKDCRMHIDINKLDKVRDRLSKRYTGDIYSFLEYIKQIHNSYSEWGTQTDIIRKKVGQNSIDIKYLLNNFKTLWKLHEDFFALCFLIQTIGDDIIWPKIQNFLSDIYEVIGIKDNHIYSSHITKILASPPDKTLSRLYLEDFINLKEVKENIDSSNKHQWEIKMEEFLSKWHWMRDRDLYYPPISKPEMVESIIEKIGFKEPTSEILWHNVFESNLKILSHFGLSNWFLEMICIGNYLHIERENHHIIWVKYVDLIRDIILIIGESLKSSNQIELKEDIFFIQIPEILNAIENNDYFVINKETIENRKNAFLQESKSKEIEKDKIFREVDYY